MRFLAKTAHLLLRSVAEEAKVFPADFVHWLQMTVLRLNCANFGPRLDMQLNFWLGGDIHGISMGPFPGCENAAGKLRQKC